MTFEKFISGHKVKSWSTLQLQMAKAMYEHDTRKLLKFKTIRFGFYYPYDIRFKSQILLVRSNVLNDHSCYHSLCRVK